MTLAISNKVKTLSLFVGLAVLFSFSHGSAPLYTSNQNTYFLHGLANGGFGNLKQDWLVGTVDPHLLFSLLISLTFRFLNEGFYYLYHGILMGVYVYSLLSIGAHFFTEKSLNLKKIWFLGLFFLIHSPLTTTILAQWGIPLYTSWFINGVAQQYVLGPYLQPSAFGVFILLSISLFLKGKHYLALGALMVTPFFHPTYLLSAALLVLAYMIALFVREKKWKPSFILGAAALVLVSPLVIYLWQTFKPASGSLAQEAREILVHTRVSHHALWTEWFDFATGLKVLLVFGALYLGRMTSLFILLLVSLCGAICLTGLQMILGHQGLALLFPWRVSVYLVPIATTVILAGCVERFFQWAARGSSPMVWALRCSGGVFILFFVAAGFYFQRGQFVPAQGRVGQWMDLMDYVRENKSQGEVYLAPVGKKEFDNFRLATGAPLYVDWKSHPFKAEEVIQWHQRYKRSQSFYQVPQIDCRDVAPFFSEGITHIISSKGVQTIECQKLTMIYSNEAYQLHQRTT